ncbi:aspartic peptidase domain-containing protein [Choanephora cucurbitarum]|nr:aspartic peptidase domain-containing protein [Choanephora cucurbitarum]
MRTTIFCLAALAQIALSTVSAEPITIPLYKRTENGDIYKAAGKQLDSGVLAGKVKIGTPAQEFTFAFDTTTGYSWVRGSRCKTENCRGRCTYYARKSSTAVSTGKKFSVEYGDSCVDTHIYTDKIEFAGLTVENMPFGGAYRMSGFATGFDGYLGLGRSVDLSNSTKYHTSSSSSLAKRDVALSDSAFVTNAYQSGSGISSSQFGMYVSSSDNNGFTQSGSVTTNTTEATAQVDTGFSSSTVGGGFGMLKRHNEEEEQAAGYLVIGGVDTSIIKGDVNYLRLADTEDGSAKNWDVCIRHAGFGDLRLEQEKNAIASISTATSYITMPPDQADQFHAKFGGKYQSATKNYLIKCSDAEKLPVLKLTLEDHIVELPAKYWIATVDADRDCCETKITRGSSDRDWVFGTSLTNAFYTTFDPENEKLGLAIKKDQEEDGLRVYKKSH